MLLKLFIENILTLKLEFLRNPYLTFYSKWFISLYNKINLMLTLTLFSQQLLKMSRNLIQIFNARANMSSSIEIERTPEVQKLLEVARTKALKSPRELAGAAFNEISLFIKNFRWECRDDLWRAFSELTEILAGATFPHTAVVENIALRVRKLMHEAFYARGPDDYGGPPIVVETGAETTGVFAARLAEGLNVLRLELEAAIETVSHQSVQHIHAAETVLLFGHSRTVELFVRNAAKRRRFRVVVCQAAPDNAGYLAVARLSAAPNIEVTLVPDACACAMLARVNKVVISCHSVSADGSLCARAGVHGLVLAAAQYGIPVMVVTGLYKLSPRYDCLRSAGGRDVDFGFPRAPFDVLDYNSFRKLNRAEVLNPTFDFIPADLITLFITDRGDFAPSYIYRLLNEMYRIEEDL